MIDALELSDCSHSAELTFIASVVNCPRHFLLLTHVIGWCIVKPNTITSICCSDLLCTQQIDSSKRLLLTFDLNIQLHTYVLYWDTPLLLQTDERPCSKDSILRPCPSVCLFLIVSKHNEPWPRVCSVYRISSSATNFGLWIYTN